MTSIYSRARTLRTKHFKFAAAFAAAPAALLFTAAATHGQGPLPARYRGDAADPNKLIRTYCVSCHSGQKAAGGFNFAHLDASHPERSPEAWEKVILKINSGMMPPAGQPRPAVSTAARAINTLAAQIDLNAERHPNPGRPALHRLNRTEYSNAVRDLLNVQVDTAALLPPDDMSRGFDNMSEVLNVSPTLLAAYVRAASRISREALGEPHAAPSETFYHVPSTVSQLQHAEGAPPGTRGGFVFTHNFPADAEYVFTSSLYFTTNTFLFGLFSQGEQLEVAIDGERVGVFAVNPRMKGDEVLRTEAVKVKAGPHAVSVSFVQKFDGPIEDLVQPFDHTLGDLFLGRTQGLTGLPHLKDVGIKGPFQPTGVSQTPSRQRILIRRPNGPEDEIASARTVLTALARQAYRRPPLPHDIDVLLSLYRQAAEKGGYEEGLRLAIQGLLVNPQFIFRFERTPVRTAGTGAYRISDLELASRISFFLWSSGPDARLIDLAASGRLRDRAVLEQEVRRLLKDPRSEALASNFAGQWLHLRNLSDIQPDLFTFPNANQNLIKAMHKETELFFASIVQNDAPVQDLLTADYTFVNEQLARHYKIPNVAGDAFQRVQISDPNRRGLLGQASVLTVTSFANRTSPVLRGKWVLDNLLGAPPPAPPAAVPPLAENSQGITPRTVRERLEEHRKNPSCAGCHNIMDPVGLALENFDATGAWRSRDNGFAIDATGKLVDGTKLTDPITLRKALLSHKDAFETAFSRRLLTYALGRGAEYYDMPAVRGIKRRAEREGGKFSSLVLGIVESAPFQLRSETPTNNKNTSGRKGDFALNKEAGSANVHH